MDFAIRDARSDDRDALAEFATDTFEWGDYVLDAFDRWLADPRGRLLVAVDDADTAIAMGRGAMLSSTELWLQAARVHPDWRRRGIASEIDHVLQDWGRDLGAQVCRLAVEDWNTAALGQVESIGMRRVGDWVHASRPAPSPIPLPAGNGGRRRPARDRLDRAPSAEAAPAFMAWSAGDIGRAARGLIAVGWTWRRLTIADLHRAARADALWMSTAGWAMAAVDEDTLDVAWLVAGPDEVDEVVRATVDLASEIGAERVELKLPRLDWVNGALERNGFETGGLVLFAKAL